MNRFAFLFLLFLGRDRSFAIPAWFAMCIFTRARSRMSHRANEKTPKKRSRNGTIRRARPGATGRRAYRFAHTYSRACALHVFACVARTRARSPRHFARFRGRFRPRVSRRRDCESRGASERRDGFAISIPFNRECLCVRDPRFRGGGAGARCDWPPARGRVSSTRLLGRVSPTRPHCYLFLSIIPRRFRTTSIFR